MNGSWPNSLCWAASGALVGPLAMDAVKAYHAIQQHTGIKAQRSLQQDLLLTTNKMSYR